MSNKSQGLGVFYEFLCEQFEPACNWKEVITMQYTGLKDTPGKGEEIYHKDLMKTNKYTYLIDWIEDGWYACREDGQDNIPLKMFLIEMPNCHLIGNKLQNPELINGA